MLTLPKRIQRKRTKGFRLGSAVYVGRPTKWGNPFFVGGYFRIDRFGSWLHHYEGLDPSFTLMETAEQCVDWYRRILKGKPSGFLAEIRGKDLACWCPTLSVWHADVLLELANK